MAAYLCFEEALVARVGGKFTLHEEKIKTFQNTNRRTKSKRPNYLLY